MTTGLILPSSAQRALAVATGLVFALALVAGLLIAPSGANATSGATRLPTIRLAAGHRVVDSHKHVWSSDGAAATGGTIVRTTHHISGTATQSLYRSARVGRFGYRLTVPSGWYRVTLGLAEQVYRKPGQRTYAVAANGATRVARLDASRMGRWRVATAGVTVRVDDGQLRLDLRPVRHAAAVSTILIVGLAHLAPTRKPIPRPSTVTGTPSPAPSSPAPSTPAPSSPQSVPGTSTSTAPGSPVSSSSTAGAPASSPAASSTPPAGTVTPEQFGARGDGVTDDTAALQRTFDGAAGRVVLLPAGRIYAHANLLHLRTAGLHVSGPGQLLATNEQESSIWIEADDVVLDGGLVVRTATTTQRWSTWDQMGIRLDGHSGITLRNIVVDGSAAAGIYVGGAARNFVLDHVTVRNTRADGIHLTGGSYNGTVTSPKVINSGDDGVAIVSYKQDGPACHNITVSSPQVLGTSWGRGLSVVGGTNITETNIDVEQTSAAAVYVGSEGDPWYTTAAANVVISGGRIVDANTDTSVDHGAVLVLSGESDVAPANIVVTSLTITGTRSSASRDLGVVTYGATPSGVVFSNITIAGGPTSAYQGNTAQSAFQLRTIVQNGVRLPDAG